MKTFTTGAEFANTLEQVGGAGGAAGGAGGMPSIASESVVTREMERNGMVPTSPTRDAATTFSDMLRNSVDKVNEAQVQADTAIKEMVAGRNKNIHETMLTIEKADASLKLMMQVRNKILDAYREIMRMQV